MTIENSISPQYLANKFVKPIDNKQDQKGFVLQTVEQSKELDVVSNVNTAIPKGLTEAISNLSQAMLNNIGAYNLVHYASYQTDDKETNGNISYVLGGYEYSISKSDKELRFSQEDLDSGKIKGMHGTSNGAIYNAIFHDGNYALGYQGSFFHYTPNDLQDKTRFYTSQDNMRENARFRPFVTNIADANPYMYNNETAIFPEALDKKDDQGYTYTDMQNSLDKIESLLDKYLVAAYQNNPDSTETNQLLFLKAKLQSLPETLQKGKQAALENFEKWIGGVTNEDELGFVMSQLQSFERFAQYETGMLAEFSMNLAALLPENQKQELMDALNVILNSTDHKAHELLGTNRQLLEAGTQLKNALGEYSQNLVSRFSAIDNTEILLNLSGDSRLQTNNNGHRSNESLIERIRSKIKSTDDSILQQVMSKITNGVKASGIAEGA